MYEKFIDKIQNDDLTKQDILQRIEQIAPAAFKDGEFCLDSFLQELKLENSSSERERERDSAFIE